VVAINPVDIARQWLGGLGGGGLGEAFKRS